MDYKFISQLIENINIALGFHHDSIEDFYTEEFCIKDKLDEAHCHHCLIKQNIHNLWESMKTLNDYTPNTSYLVQLIDAEAFRFALVKSGAFKSVNCYPLFEDENAAFNYPDSEPYSYGINATIERFAMDGNGFHVGYETVTYQWKAIKKTDFEIHGIPYLLSAWVINPNQFELIHKDLPDDEEPIHDEDCEFKDFDSFDNCDCAEFWNGYFQPDDDFFDDQIQAILSQLNYPDAEFDSDRREWTLGDLSFNLNSYETDPDYKNDCNIEFGAPWH